MAGPTVTIHQPEFLPWLGFWDKARASDVLVLLDNVPFRKNYFQNRNKARTAAPEGWTWLTVPVLLGGNSGQAIAEVAVNPVGDWRRKILGTVEQNYRKAPCFDAVFPEFKALLESPWPRVADLNCALIGWMAPYFGVGARQVRASSLAAEGTSSALILSLCRATGAGRYLSGISGRDYLDLPSFEAAGIPVDFQEFRHPVYPQLREPFMPCMSGLELMLLKGRGAAETLANPAARLETVFL